MKLDTFCADAGPELIAEYSDRRLGMPFPKEGLPSKSREKGKHIATLIEGLPDEARRRTKADFSQCEGLSRPAAQESLRQVLPSGDWIKISRTHKSARQRALFCLLHRKNYFLDAEFLVSHKARRLSQFGSAIYTTYGHHDPDSLRLDPAAEAKLEASVNATLSHRVLKGSKCFFNIAIVHNEIAARPEKVFQLGIGWVDGTFALAMQSDGQRQWEMADRARMIVITYFPSAGRIVITGSGLKSSGFDTLAAAFTQNVLGVLEPPERAICDLFLPQQFLSEKSLDIPAGAGIANICFRSLCLIPPTGPGPVTLMVDPGMSLRNQVRRTLGTDFYTHRLQGCETNSAKIEVTLEAHNNAAKASKFTADISRNGIKLTNQTDQALRALYSVLDANGIMVRGADVPLIRHAA